MGSLSDTVCIFDLDGTLVDSAPDLTATLNRILVREGLQPMEPSAVRPLVGNGARALLHHSFEKQARAFPADTAGEALVTAFVEDYAAHISVESTVFDGVEGTLNELAAEGASLAVCTNKTERLAHPLLEDMDLTRFFEIVVAADTLAEKKPSALPLRHIISELDARRAVMIGDTATDFLAARAADIPAVIAKFGYGPDDPRITGAIHFDHYRDLPRVIRQLLG